MKNNFKDTYIIIVGRVIMVLFSLFTLRTITYYFTEIELGLYYIYMAITATCNLLLLNPVSVYFQRHSLNWRGSDNASAFLYVFALLLLGVICLFIIRLTSPIDEITSFSVMLYLYLSITVAAINRNLLNTLNVNGFPKQFVVGIVSICTLSFSIAFTCVVYFGNTAINWLLGTMLAELVLLPFTIYMYKRYCGGFIVRGLNIRRTRYLIEFSKGFFVFTAPISISNVFMWGQSQAYKFIVENKFSLEMLAEVTVGISVASAIFVAIESVVQQVFYPKYINEVNGINEKYKLAEVWNKYIEDVVPFYFSVFTFAYLLAPQIVIILLDDKYMHVFKITQVAMVSELLRVVIGLLLWNTYAQKKTYISIPAYMVSFIFISIGLSYGVIVESIDISIYLLLGMIASFFIHWLLIRKNIPIKLFSFGMKHVIIFVPIIVYSILNVDVLTFSSSLYHIFLVGLSYTLCLFCFFKYTGKKL